MLDYVSSNTALLCYDRPCSVLSVHDHTCIHESGDTLLDSLPVFGTLLLPRVSTWLRVPDDPNINILPEHYIRPEL